MRKFSLHPLKEEIRKKIGERISNANNNITVMIDAKDSSGMVRVKGESYYGTAAKELAGLKKFSEIVNLKMDSKSITRITSYISIMNKAKEDWNLITWYFAKLSRVKSLGDVYHALPDSYHKYLPGKKESFQMQEDVLDQDAYDALQQLELITYLENS